jgi:protein O-mannosyl-transferase
MSADMPQAVSKKSVMVAQALVLLTAALLIYWPSFRAPFQLDDFGNIVNNKYINISNLRPHTLLMAAFQDFHQNRLLSNLSLAVNFYLSQERTYSYHLFNFLVLIFTALGIWLLLIKLFRLLKFEPSRANWAAWLSVLVWVGHPVNIQAVTYIVQRHASLAGAFSIWSIYFYHLARERQKFRPALYFICALFCLLAVLSKETAAVLPALIFAYGLYFFDGFSGGWVRRNRGWIVGLAVFYLLCAALVLRPSLIEKGAFSFHKVWFTGWEKFLTAPRTVVWYISLLLFPIPQHLSVVHDYPVSKSLFQPWTTAVCFLIVLAVIAAAACGARRWRLFSFAAVWYLGNLLIESLPLPIDLVNEHRLYLAALAIIVPAVAWPVFKFQKLRWAVAWVLLVAAIFGFFAHGRNLVWRQWDTLWRDAVIKAPQSSLAWKSYCAVFSDRGMCEVAVKVCAKAEELGSKSYTTRYMQGKCHMSMGRLDLAEQELREAVQLAPVSQRYNFMVYNLALLYNLKGDYEYSARWCQTVISMEPSNVQARLLFAHDLLALREEEGYLMEMKNILELAPGELEARKELALALAERGRCDESLSLIANFNLPEDDLKQIYAHCRK